jgi:hypothetical protein
MLHESMFRLRLKIKIERNSSISSIRALILLFTYYYFSWKKRRKNNYRITRKYWTISKVSWRTLLKVFLFLDLPVGEHQYKFFVDDNWTHDRHLQNELPPQFPTSMLFCFFHAISWKISCFLRAWCPMQVKRVSGTKSLGNHRIYG